jgi:hypothetical protein
VAETVLSSQALPHWRARRVLEYIEAHLKFVAAMPGAWRRARDTGRHTMCAG